MMMMIVMIPVTFLFPRIRRNRGQHAVSLLARRMIQFRPGDVRERQLRVRDPVEQVAQ
jgi:hypothetical protein